MWQWFKDAYSLMGGPAFMCFIWALVLAAFIVVGLIMEIWNFVKRQFK